MNKKTETLFKHGEFSNVNLSAAELARLKDRFGERGARQWIDDLSLYLAKHTNPETGKLTGPPSKYKWHYAVIIGWARKQRVWDADTEAAADDPAVGDMQHLCRMCPETHVWTCTDLFHSVSHDRLMACPKAIGALKSKSAGHV